MLGDKRTLGQLAVFGGVGLFLCQITYTIVIGYTNAGTATVLQTTGIAFVMLFTCVPRDFHAAGARGGGAGGRRRSHLAHRHAGRSERAVPAARGPGGGIANGLSVAFYIMYLKSCSLAGAASR